MLFFSIAVNLPFWRMSRWLRVQQTNRAMGVNDDIPLAALLVFRHVVSYGQGRRRNVTDDHSKEKKKKKKKCNRKKNRSTFQFSCSSTSHKPIPPFHRRRLSWCPDGDDRTRVAGFSRGGEKLTHQDEGGNRNTHTHTHQNLFPPSTCNFFFLFLSKVSSSWSIGTDTRELESYQTDTKPVFFI